jgi:hypothetical protein
MPRAKAKRTTQSKATASAERSPDTTAANLFETLCEEYSKAADVEFGGSRAGFGSNALKVNGKIFAMVSSRGQLVFKLPAARTRELTDEGVGTPFDPGRGRLMREWLVLLKPSRVRARTLANEALEFGRKAK